MYGTPNSSSSCITSLRMASETVSASLAALRAASCNSTRSSLVIGQGMSVSGAETHASRWKGTTGRMMNPPDDPRFMYRGRWQLVPGEGERTHKGKKNSKHATILTPGLPLTQVLQKRRELPQRGFQGVPVPSATQEQEHTRACSTGVTSSVLWRPKGKW
jgi:hypothetical protein